MKPPATCHPDRDHYAHGLCKGCYKKWLLRKNSNSKARDQASKAARRVKRKGEIAAQQRARYAANRIFERDRAYGYRVKKKYGIEMAEYLALLAKQKHSCAICNAPQQEHKRLAMDHCHKSGRNRALLCSRCNTTLGAVGEDRALLLRMASYLLKHSII